MATTSGTTTTTTPTVFPNQQQPQVQQQVTYPQTISSNNPSSSSALSRGGGGGGGSIGPFFVVISVVVVLAIVSCLLGRFCIGKEETPLESIKYRGSCFARLKNRLRRCFSRDVHGGIGVGGGRGVKVANATPPLPDERGSDGN